MKTTTRKTTTARKATATARRTSARKATTTATARKATATARRTSARKATTTATARKTRGLCGIRQSGTVPTATQIKDIVKFINCLNAEGLQQLYWYFENEWSDVIDYIPEKTLVVAFKKYFYDLIKDNKFYVEDMADSTSYRVLANIHVIRGKEKTYNNLYRKYSFHIYCSIPR